jgi:hypothetical protein
LIKHTFIVFSLLISQLAICQSEFIPPETSEVLKYEYKHELKWNIKLTSKEATGEYKKQLKRFYKTKYKSSVFLANYDHFFFNEDWNNYLTNLTYKIASSNEDYDFSRIQPVISSYFWANAYSIGEGTVVINPGIIPYLQNEDQLAFILCHEFAHYVLKHSERQYVELLKELETGEFEQQIEDISDSEFYQTTQLKRLLRSKLYETRKHHRSLEIEADSLGLEFFKNAGFNTKEALTTLQVLDRISGKMSYDLDIPKITQVPLVDYESSGLLKSANNSQDSWLDLDSIKTHPDCARRFNLMSQSLGIDASFTDFTSDFEPSESFNTFKQELSYFIVECYLHYHRVDMALLSIWNQIEAGDSNIYLKKTNFHALADLVYSRKKHKAGHIFTFPNDSMSEAHHALSSMIFGMRYKEFVQTFYDLAMDSYDNSFDDEETWYALIKLAVCTGDKEGLRYYKAEYFTKFDRFTGKYYEDIKYIH